MGKFAAISMTIYIYIGLWARAYSQPEKLRYDLIYYTLIILALSFLRKKTLIGQAIARYILRLVMR